MSCSCHKPALHLAGIFPTSVIHLPYTCPTPALHLSYTYATLSNACPTPALYFCSPPALHLPHTYSTPALQLSYIWLTYSLYLPYTCPTSALHLHMYHLSYACPTHAIPYPISVLYFPFILCCLPIDRRYGQRPRYEISDPHVTANRFPKLVTCETRQSRRNNVMST